MSRHGKHFVDLGSAAALARAGLLSGVHCESAIGRWAPAALAVALQTIASLSSATEVTAGRSCGAAWIPNASQAVQWYRIDAAQGVLAIGSEVVARLEFFAQGATMRAREHPLDTLPDAQVQNDADPALLRVEAQFGLDSSCVLSIHGLVRSTPDSRLADLATAYSLAGSASDAQKGDDPERASLLATRAFFLLPPLSISQFPQRLDFAAFAVETLLQAGHWDRAAEILASASEAGAAGLPDDHPSRLRLELARARVLSFSDKNEAALVLRLQLQPGVLAIFGIASDESLSNRLRIANLRLELGQYHQARIDLEGLRDSINRARNPGDALRISTTRALANALALLDLETQSVELLTQLRDELVIAHGQSDGRVIDVEEQIARMQTRLEQFESALQGASRVFLWRVEHLGFADVRTLQTAWILALLYKEFGRYDTARALIGAMLDESGRAATRVPRQLTLRTLALLGSIEGAQGNLDAAEEILRSTWQEYTTILGENSDDTARALLGYALVLVQSGRVARICPVVQRVFDENRGSLPPDLQLRALSKTLVGLCLLTDSPSTEVVGRALAKLRDGWNELRGREGAGSSTAMYALSTLAWANYRYGDRRAAKQLLQQLVAMAEKSRLAAAPGSDTRDHWFSKWVTDHSQNLGYRTLALLNAQDGEIDEAIRISELARDRRLGDRFFERDWLAQAMPTEARQRLGALISEIHELDEQLSLQADIVDRVKLETRRSLSVAARDEIERLISQRYRVKPAELAVPPVSRLRSMLDAGTVVVSVQLSADRWWALVIARDSPVRFVMLDHEPDVRIAMRAWMSLLGGVPARAWPTEGNRLVLGYERPASAVGHHLSAEQLAERVARAIFDPLRLAAPGARRFVVVADDELNSLPFGAMPIDGVAAIDRFEVLYAPSLGTYAALIGSADHGAWAKDLLSFAVDDIAAVKPVPAGAVDMPSHGDSIRSMLEYASRHPLPFASKEAEAVSRNFAPVRTTVIRGSEATKARLVKASHDGSLSKYRYVHIAAHALSFPNDPERSMLLLNGAGSVNAAAGILTAAELANLKMGSELLVLAGCGTAVGRYEPGQGLLGFAFAALAAGNQAAVLSLWEVADDLTQRFMSGFFDRLRRGMRPSAALRATQRQFAHDPDPRINNPGTWAAFVLYGRS